MRILSLYNIKKNKHHVAYDTILGMEDCFINNDCCISNFSIIISFLNKILRKIGMKSIIPDFFLLRTIDFGEDTFFAAMSHFDLECYCATLKKISKKSKLGIYCFDVWEPDFSLWKSLFDEIKPSIIFFAYKNAQRYFSNIYNSVFLPQSMDSRFFYPRQINKTRLFIQIGRRVNSIHNMIISYLKDNEIEISDENYVFEKIKGLIIYSNTNDLAENICRSKYFIAAPKSIDTSELTGNISDVTARFYEAMACKTLIVGYKPDTFDELFPTDAMLEVNNESFSEKINWMNSNTDYYNEIVERNYAFLMKNHTWNNRYSLIKASFDDISFSEIN